MRYDDDLTGVRDPDFLAIGLGGTNMMAMIWSVAMGKRAVGVEMRGDPFLGVHWNIRADFYHQLGVVDQMMLERYGDEGVPRRGNGDRFKLAELFFGPKTEAGDIMADGIINGFDNVRHIAGTIHHVEFIDDRWRDGVPNRSITLLQPPPPPPEPVPAAIRESVIEVLDGPSTFQAGASAILILLRRYLEKIEEMDIERGITPRVRLFTQHRVVPTEGDGFIKQPDGRFAVRIERLQELDFKGRFVRVRAPGTQPIDLGVPRLFMIAEGFKSTDAERLGFKQEDVTYDHGDGRGPLVAQADFLAGLIEVLVGGRLRRRIASEFDKDGHEYWVRQIAVGHENDPEVGWILVQVPDYKTFDPIAEGLVPAGTDPKSPEYFAGYDQLVHDYYMEQIADILELPAKDLKQMKMVYGPKMFSLVERMGEHARVAPNGVVAGDSFGNGHFLTSGGAMTGMVGHGWRVLAFWKELEAGIDVDAAIESLAERIKTDTLGWLHVSATEYTDALPINFGAERIRQISESAKGTGSTGKAALIESSRRVRHSLVPLNPSDWRRPLLRAGRVFTGKLPELHAVHPALRRKPRARKAAKVALGYLVQEFTPQTLRFLDAVLSQPGVQMGLVTQDDLGKLTDRIRDRLVASATVPDATDAQAVAAAFKAMESVLGRPELLLGSEEPVQVTLGHARASLGVTGRDAATAMRFASAADVRETLQMAGLPVAQHALVRSAEDGIEFAEERGFYPLVLRPARGGTAADVHRIETEAELHELLTRLEPTDDRPLLIEAPGSGEECTLEVMCVNGVPAWTSSSRLSHPLLTVRSTPGLPWSITLPREADAPADSHVRQMGFAALRALGMDSGIATVSWFRRADGTAVLSDVTSRPPGRHAFALMAHSYGADLYRAWANAVVNGVFSPIPRLYASGVAFLRGQGEGDIVAGVEGWEAVRDALGDVVVEAVIPMAGQARAAGPEGEGYVVVRHEDTAAVDAALARIRDGVKVTMGRR